MVAHSREDFSYLEIYRPVEAGVDEFMDRVHAHGEMAFGNRTDAVLTTPSFEPDANGDATPVMAVNGVPRPRLEVYRPNELRLRYIERRAEPEMNYAPKFGNALRRTITNPEETLHGDRIPELEPPKKETADEDEKEKTGKKEKMRDSLAYHFEVIGRKYGVTDQSRIEVNFSSIDIPIDPALEHRGLEIYLVPDPATKVTRMLIEQAGVCIRGLGRKSREVTNPWTPTGLRMPFARMPSDAGQEQMDRFLQAIEGELPLLHVVLGGFRDTIGGASWTKRR